MATFPPEAGDFEDRFRKYLPRSSDLTLVVLKGHLLMEEQVDGLISDLLPNPDALEQARPNLYIRLRLARALLSPGTLGELLDAAEKLNSLRNKLVHRLEPPEIAHHVDDFIRPLEDPDAPIAEFESQPVARRLKRCIALLCGSFSGFRQGYGAARARAALTT
jgi:hypothetical protein